MAPDTVEREILIDAPPRVVWSIVTEAEHLAGCGTYEGRVETVDPPRLFAFRWQTREGEFSEANSTLVVMTLEAEETGTRLRVVESGFATLPWPDNARARYADENSKGWLTELDELRDYVARTVGAHSDR